jgi:hypothetical protein
LRIKVLFHVETQWTWVCGEERSRESCRGDIHPCETPKAAPRWGVEFPLSFFCCLKQARGGVTIRRNGNYVRDGGAQMGWENHKMLLLGASGLEGDARWEDLRDSHGA